MRQPFYCILALAIVPLSLASAASGQTPDASLSKQAASTLAALQPANMLSQSSDNLWQVYALKLKAANPDKHAQVDQFVSQTRQAVSTNLSQAVEAIAARKLASTFSASELDRIRAIATSPDGVLLLKAASISGATLHPLTAKMPQSSDGAIALPGLDEAARKEGLNPPSNLPLAPPAPPAPGAQRR
ncbi:MAG TPA: hypothetical protein VNS79_10630 [Sphingobium sp.]|nr:hypothetical protein [Sphingobium sp.]